jgi:hypothetical protein
MNPHIAATVNTLFLAYLGASLPLIVLFAASRQPTGLILNGELVAIEVVRTLVGSLGIVAAVPLTTLIAVWLTAERGGAERPLRRPAMALVGGLAAIGLVTAAVATVMSPMLATPPRAAIVPDEFGGTPPPSVAPSPSDFVEGPRGDAPIIQVGSTMPLVDGAAALGDDGRAVPRGRVPAAGGGALPRDASLRHPS